MRRSLLSLLLVAIGLAAAGVRAPSAQETAVQLMLPEPDRRAIRQVIESQIQAFLRDDGATAFSFATPSIQSQFQTPEVFMQMVRSGYQPVYRPQAVTFKDVIEFNGGPAQRVVVIGPDGVAVMAVYPMRQMPDGVWRIDGCFILAFRRDDV
ncbi:MAG: DUF4864 domain-containing protein [Alphaproteobacteria bacterium]|nr:DUF4864 domain-containing protein [Alphaproteobacteria bacterium]